MTSQLPAFRSTLHALMVGYQERLAARIRAERKSRGMKREDAARLAGISFRQYQRWESGQSEPRDANLQQLADGWGVGIEALRPPDPEHEERDVRGQLDRMETMLEEIYTAVTGRPAAALSLEPEHPLDQVALELEAAAEEHGQPPARTAKAATARRRAARKR